MIDKKNAKVFIPIGSDQPLTEEELRDMSEWQCKYYIALHALSKIRFFASMIEHDRAAEKIISDIYKYADKTINRLEYGVGDQPMFMKIDADGGS